MSLHAQLSPEAQARLHAQQRNSTITSIAISLLVVLLIGVVLLYLLLPPIDNFTPEIVSYQAGADDKEKVQKREMTRAVERKPSAPSSSMAKVIAAATTSPTAVPVPEVDVPDPSTDFGNGDDFGDGWGSGDGDGGGFGAIPASMSKRCSKADRLDRLTKNGGNERCEIAVEKTLQWLKKNQNPNGSWGDRFPVAMTGFAILTYLGRCETPNSEEYGDSVTRGLVYLTNICMRNNGKMASDFRDGHWVYEHGIATYALGEATTFCTKLGINLPKLKEATKLAGDTIIRGQAPSGGWLYGYAKANKGDNSVGMWQVQALKACKHTGLWEERAFNGTIKKALKFVEATQAKSGGVGYSSAYGGGAHHYTMTGAGVLAHQIWGKGSSSVVRKGSKFILKTLNYDYKKHVNLYSEYYNAQVMINRGGRDWDKYNAAFRDQLLDNQSPDGSWPVSADRSYGLANENNTWSGPKMSMVYRTCLCALSLEVYYRFLPATGSGH